MRRIIITAAGAALALGGVSALAGCGSTIESGVEGATGVEIDANEEGVEITDDEGNSFQAGEDVKVPDTWPSDVPLYDGRLTAAIAAGEGANLIWQSDSSVNDAYAEYSAQLESAGFNDQNAGAALNQDGVVRTANFESDKTVVIVVVTDAGDGTKLSATAAPKS
jgi:hypothetical protein